MRNLLTAVAFSLLLSGCMKNDKSDFSREIRYFFHDDMQEWKVMYSDYPVGEESFYELESGLTRLPLPLDTTLNAVKISGNNHSDDLFSYMYVPITSLAPNTTYKVTFLLHLASNVATGSVGAGGSPDLAVGVGGLDTVPSNYIDGENYYRPRFNVELQSGLSNEIMQVAGNLGVTDTTTFYAPITRGNPENPMELTTNGNGTFYLLVGWDSGFEGITTIYIKTVIVWIEHNN